jgi:hypothetical protein
MRTVALVHLLAAFVFLMRGEFAVSAVLFVLTIRALIPKRVHHISRRERPQTSAES